MIFKNHTDQTYQLLAEFKRSPAPVDKSLKNKKIYCHLQKEEKFNIFSSAASLIGLKLHLKYIIFGKTDT